MKTFWRVAGGLLVAWFVLLLAMRMIAAPGETAFEFESGEGRQLIVIVHGLSGRQAIQPTVDLARAAFAQADLLTIAYDARLLSNADPYEIANRLEAEIHERDSAAEYGSIILLGHSMGGMIVRKALLWGNALEEDRVAPKGRRAWAGRVERVVSLAGINRGWSIEPRPRNMTHGKFVSILLGERIARLTGTGELLLAMRRGAPFIADSRVQWTRLARSPSPDGSLRALPQVIHLLGDRDDIVSREDAQDLGVAKDTVFVTLAGTDHGNIGEAVSGAPGSDAERRRDAIRNAILGRVDRMSPDRTQALTENLEVRRIIYLMHGIRDYGGWTDQVRDSIEQHPAVADGALVVVNKKYGYFPMGPFLLYWDRQKNVRKFMDEYTENIAHYPHVARFDFVGHSNGTYILASALQHYRTLKMGRVFFAGSVVPKHYPWRVLMDRGRVEKVVNVVASGDWVVALFPKIFEQVADWLSVRPTVGLLDLGAAGFRGFLDADDPQKRVRNLQFATGQHGTGVDITQEQKLQAIVAFAVEGDERSLEVFQDSHEQLGWLNVLSNISWVVWIALAAILGGFGYMAFNRHVGVGAAFVLVVLGLLTSV